MVGYRFERETAQIDYSINRIMDAWCCRRERDEITFNHKVHQGHEDKSKKLCELCALCG
jgi:hypothetical protein